MTATLAPEPRPIGGVALQIFERGRGRPILILHGAGGLAPDAPFLDGLAAHGRVVAPTHPGFGRTPLPDWIATVDDLAYLYLDLLDELDLRDAALVGFSMGGWLACEIATKCRQRLAKIALVDPVGIKVGGRETRDIPDIFALPPEEVARLQYHDPAKAPDPAKLSDDELYLLAKNREAAALYLWEPYMHNPQLLRRLHRITVPTLVLRGASDGIVSDGYARAFAAAIPNARYDTIADAGHSPQIEQPAAFTARLARFLSEDV